MYAQAGLRMCCWHTSEDRFSRDKVHLSLMQERPLTKTLQRGDDQQFDQVRIVDNNIENTGEFLPLSGGRISAPFPIENSHLFPNTMSDFPN